MVAKKKYTGFDKEEDLLQIKSEFKVEVQVEPKAVRFQIVILIGFGCLEGRKSFPFHLGEEKTE